MAQLLIDGRRLAYERLGDGFPTIFLNGSGSTMAKAEPLWRSLALGREILAHDYCGLGASDGGPPVSMASFASDTVALADELGWDEFDLLGVSFGGMVALELVCSFPRRCRRLVLMCTSAGGMCGASYPLHELLDIGPDERRRRMPSISDIRFTDEYLTDHPNLRLLIDQSIEDRPPTAGEREQMAARRLHDVCSRLDRVEAETLVMAGEFDGIAPPANGRAIAERIDGATYREYIGGHMFFIQDGRAMVDALDFLDGGRERLGR
jgi:3-oxoadipate enol-lactonase